MRRTLVFFFGTNTGFATHVASVCSSLIKPASRSRSISDSIALRFGSEKRRKGYLIGLASGSKFRWCSASSLGTPGMSAGHHAKIFQCSRRNSTSALSYLGSMLAPTETCLEESPGMRSCFLVSIAALKEVFCSEICFLVVCISVGSTAAL